MQETANERILCASVVLDQKPDPLQQYLATAVYESCRKGELALSGFPDFDTHIQRLRDSKPEAPSQQYQVCVKRGESLVVLGAYCSKWLESEQFKSDANALIEHHNGLYNSDGDFVEEESRRELLAKNLLWLLSSTTIRRILWYGLWFYMMLLCLNYGYQIG